MSKRIAFRMVLNPGQAAEYKKRHDEIWPELAKALRDAGISDYSIWLDPENQPSLRDAFAGRQQHHGQVARDRDLSLIHI